MARLHRRNFLPAFLCSIFWWICSLLWVVFVSPEWKITLNIFNKELNIPISILLLLLFLFLALFLTLSLLFGNVRRGMFLAFYCFLILIFRLLKIGHWYNICILTLILLTQEYYFISKK